MAITPPHINETEFLFITTAGIVRAYKLAIWRAAAAAVAAASRSRPGKHMFCS